jgi:hypothetical protein
MNGDELTYDDVRLIARILQSARPGAALAFRHGDVEVELIRGDVEQPSAAAPVAAGPDATPGG